MATVLEQLAAGHAQETPQPSEGASYAPKIRDAETAIDWSKSAREIERAVRAFRPAPGAQTVVRGMQCKLWGARLTEGTAQAGIVLAVGPEGIRVACGEGALEITELQRAGGRRLPAAEFLRGCPLAVGERLATAG